MGPKSFCFILTSSREISSPLSPFLTDHQAFPRDLPQTRLNFLAIQQSVTLPHAGPAARRWEERDMVLVGEVLNLS